MEIKDLYDNKWLSLKEISDKDKHIEGYVYATETRCGGVIIAIIPFRYNNDQLEYLTIKGITPAWSTNIAYYSSLTGGRDENTSVLDQVIQELQEESGYICEKEELIDLGACNATKCMDTIYCLFAVDLSDKEHGKATTDGSTTERMARAIWVKNISMSTDPILYTLFYKLVEYLKLKGKTKELL